MGPRTISARNPFVNGRTDAHGLLLIGAPVAMFCVRYVKSQLYEISSVNLTVMVAAAATLAVSAAIAGIIPARRAASINPVEALRVG